MPRFIRFGQTIINLNAVRTIEHVTPLTSAGSHKIRINYQAPRGPTGGALFFSSPDISESWFFQKEEDAKKFLDEIEHKIAVATF